MAYNYNHIVLVGRLTADPDTKDMGDTKMTKFRLAVNRPYRKEDGSTEADFLDVVLWGKLAEIGIKCLAKGAPVLVEGRIQSRKFEHNGEKRTSVEIVSTNFQLMGDAPKKDEGKAVERPSFKPGPSSSEYPASKVETNDVPF